MVRYLGAPVTQVSLNRSLEELFTILFSFSIVLYRPNKNSFWSINILPSALCIKAITTTGCSLIQLLHNPVFLVMRREPAHRNKVQLTVV